MRPLFVLVPSLVPTGPIKGAIALCNSLAADGDVTLVALKPSPALAGPIDARIKVVDLGGLGGWGARLREYRRLLQQAGGARQAVSLSFCFSADVVNFFARRHAITVSSIRGHLLRTYKVDYGPAGVPLAIVHFLVAGRLARVIAMTDRMARQFAAVAGKRPVVIGNFIDEPQLEPLRSPAAAESGALRFVFVGRLSPLKRPGQVIDALCRLSDQGIACSLDIYGDGPLLEALTNRVAALGRKDIIRFHGHVGNPWTLAANAHCLVLPSLTEGISRAALEALYLGIPCVMRDVDSNSELIRSGGNGELFEDDGALVAAMKNAAQLGRRLAPSRPILLGEQFRQTTCIGSYRQLLEVL